MLSQTNLPEAIIPKCVDILSKISDGERDLIRVVVDVVTELREGEGDDDGDVRRVLPNRSHLTQQIPDSQSSVASPVRPRRKSVMPRFDPNDPEVAMKAALIDLRCLVICISLLERVNSVSLVAEPG